MELPKLKVGDSGDEVARLQDRLEFHGVEVSPEERKRRFFGPSTREAISGFQKAHGIDPSCEVCEKTAVLLSGPPETVVFAPDVKPAPASTVVAGTEVSRFPRPTPDAPSRPLPSDGDTSRVEGRIFFDHGLPAGGVSLRLYNKGFGGAETRLGEIKTDSQGFYAQPYSTGGKPANLEVRVVDAQGKEIPLSATKFNAGKQEKLNLVAPASVRPLAAEYQRLTGDIARQVGELNTLAGARESAERQDLTLLHQATGWDARLIAFAATASKLSTETGIPQDTLYALFRAGLPTDKQQLAFVSVGAMEKALVKAREAGIVSLSDQQVAGVKTAFEDFARATRRAAKAPGALSSFGDLLSRSGLNDNEQRAFESAYFSHRGAPAEMWQKAREKGVSEANINGLRLQGKLAYLTLNNASLAGSLQDEIGSPDNLAQLVKGDYYQKDAWKTRLNNMAGNSEQELQKIIPPAYAGETIVDRLDAYAADLARKVRLSFPTRVVARMIEKDELSLGATYTDVKKRNVLTLLKNAEGLGFELGRVPVDAFVKKHEGEIFKDIQPASTLDDAKMEATQSLKKLQRLYQVTPSDEALKVVLDLGFNSAYDVTAFTYDGFLTRFGHKFRSRDEAQLVYRKAEQVTTVTYNFFTAARQSESAPPIFAVSPPAAVRESARNELIKHYPTMESLFGSLDFCECEHCRSVLSPAAYFVDLLQFLDYDELVWKEFLDDWKEKHSGEAYQKDWKKQGTNQPQPDEEKTPYHALIERRPDLLHLPLTCENTHTALPYIDVVNEILEYYVAKEKLDEKAAHDTGAATTPELLAEPQNVIPEAYDKLKSARYPLALPFDLWLETVRRFFDHFETPLWRVLELFRPVDDLFPPAVSPKPYYRASIFAERLGISSSEYDIFTAASPLSKWFELYGYANEVEALAALKSAKTLSRRLGVSYKELVELVRTGFINPRLDVLVILRKLDVDANELFRYKGQTGFQPFSAEEKEAFEDRLAELAESLNLTLDDAKAQLETAWQTGRVNEILLLADPDTGCSFDLTTLRYADGSDANALVFLKINLFVRLWKKLGWTMEETDRALQVFLPTKSASLTGSNIGESFKTALVYLAHLKALDERVKVGKNSRVKLLTLWSNLPTTGRNPLYAQFFLTKSVLMNDAAFDDPLGNYLSKAGILIKDHLLALQSALNLTADDVGRILADAGQSLETAALSLDNVSLLHRHGLLARALKLSVRDLIALKLLSGLDPFRPLGAAPLTDLAGDHPFNQTLRFVEVAEIIKESGFKVEDLEYLLRDRFDPVGKYRANAEAMLAMVKNLAAEAGRIKTEHAVPDDPAAFTDGTLRQKLALALPADVAETFLAMWVGTREYEAVYPNPVIPANKLNPETFSQEPAIRVSYNEARQEQRLTVRGALSDARKAELKATFPSPMVGSLLDAAQDQAKAFFKKHFERLVAEEPFVGFLEAADFEIIFAPIPDGLSDADKQDRMRGKREKLAKAFLPFLQQKLIRQLVVQTLATSLGADPALTETLLTKADLLADPSQPGKPLLDAFAAVGGRGVSATFFASTGGTGAPLQPTSITDTADTTTKPVTTKSARFEGYLEVPATGAYRFFAIFGKKDATAELRFAHLPDPLLRGASATDGAEISQFTELKTGVPYRFTLDVGTLGGGDVTLLILGENLPKGSLGRLTLYPEASVERVRRAQGLLAKTLQLIQGLGLGEREMRYLVTHAADFDNLDLSKLPTREADDSPAAATALFGQFLRLAGYARLKRDLAAATDDLVTIFENARRVHPASADANQAKSALLDDLCRRVANLTRRDVEIIRTTAEDLGFTAQSTIVGNELRVEAADFAHEKGIQRLWEVLQVVEKLGVPIEAIVRWATPAPDFAVARDLKNTVKARYEPENWQRIAQSIFDKLRQRQRDALVAYIIHQRGFERLEQLFEYFLIDPGMEPVVQTSRLRLAISSVQLFIQRCLLNLEPKVHPSVINSKHWQWMKRYRVWEANRKIFLFPENWLEPEFRDDKTHLFQELESALLQGDVSNDLVEDAFFQYLKKLEELARLDIVAMYCEEKPLDPSSNILHVIGRTYSLPHKYFYRRYAHQMWTPWEPVTAEIEGDHVVAVVWRERLNLFWLTFLEKAKPNTSGQPLALNINDLKIPTAVQKEVEVQLNWSEYFQGGWTTRESSGFGDPIRVNVSSDFNSRSVFIYVNKEYEGGEERAVKINLSGAIDRAFRVVSKNSQPEPDFNVYLLDLPYPHADRRVTRYMGSGLLEVDFIERIKTEDSNQPETTQATKEILRQGRGYSLLTCNDLFSVDFSALFESFGPDADWEDLTQWFLNVAQPGMLISPFFYQDNQHTFFVEPSLTETTIDRWEEWIVSSPPFNPKLEDDDWWRGVPIEPMIPIIPDVFVVKPPFPPDPGWIDPIDPIARFKVQPKDDWVINPATALQFDGRLVGQVGGLDFAVLPAATGIRGFGAQVNVIPGAELEMGSVPVTPGRREVKSGGLALSGGTLNVVGGSGLNSAVLENLNVTRGLNITSGFAGGELNGGLLNH
ncbi:MAG: peptidoglycan-binding protein [Acidobacteria bacterium]|nr:peptidoglycan-binding protein [Acidobacteriota bacterium]